MTEYISREDILDIASQYCTDDDGSCSKADVDLREMLDEIEALPSADVQTVDRWISVDEALPIYDELVLAVDKNNTIRLGIYTDLGWTSQFGNPMAAHITHWRPLPEPPQD